MARWVWSDAYHHLLVAPWTGFVGLLFLGFMLFNLVFTVLYRLGGDCINAEHPASWLETFSFSVQTMAAIGYGAMAPTTPYAYVVSNLEGFLGLMVFAMASGLMFARFSRPTARINFSDVAVIHPRNGKPTLQFRVSNERGNQILDARVHVAALLDEVTQEGQRMRRIVDLPLARSNSPVFSMSWVVMHTVDASSPVYPLLGSADEGDAFVALIVNLTGIDESSVQTVYARTAYPIEQIRPGERFVDMLEVSEGGAAVVHYSRIHDTVPFEHPTG